MKLTMKILTWIFATFTILVGISLVRSIAIIYSETNSTRIDITTNFVKIKAIILIVSIILTIIFYKLSKKAFAETILTMGKIVFVIETGNQSKGNIELKIMVEIQLDNGSYITGEIIKSMKNYQIDEYRIGLIVPVRYNKTNPKIMQLDLNPKPEEIDNIFAFKNEAGIQSQNIFETDKKSKNNKNNKNILNKKIQFTPLESKNLTLGLLLSVNSIEELANDKTRVEMVIEVFLSPNNKTQVTTQMDVINLDLIHITQGNTVPIIYDKNSPKKCRIVFNISPKDLQIAYDNFSVQKGLVDPELLEISKRGLSAKGVIKESKITGNIINGKTEMELLVAVTTPNGETFDVNVKRGMSKEAIPQLHKGALMGISYLPEDKSKIAITIRVEKQIVTKR